MLAPCVALVLVYAYYPMIGVVIAFQRYNPRLGFFGSKWMGLENFRYLMNLPNTPSVIFNTVFISFMKIAAGLAVPIVYAVLLDLIHHSGLKRAIQTLLYIPYFMSWVILGGILLDLLSPSTGLLAELWRLFGAEPIFFLANPRLFPYVLVVTDIWKTAGYGTIIYLASITAIDPSLYEAAIVDGANRMKQVWHITLPGMAPIIVLMMTLSLGNVLNAGFEQVVTLYSPIVYSTGDIIDTFVYRIGLINNQFGVATAAGLFKSLISFVFIAMGYSLAYRFADYTVF
ncbi:MAG: ABC transporter permease subunit [Oscillospiraceae bacterium]|nr:ABC transporter permease subunit [Oscillospiraceae bacterium]